MEVREMKTEKMANYLVPNKAVSMLTGVQYAKHGNGTSTLVYTDGSEETANIPMPTADNFLEIVGTIQRIARK